MHWLQDIDTYLFHWVNPALNNRVLDVLMPFCSGNSFFVPVFLLICLTLAWRGGLRGCICVAMVLLAIGLGDTLVCNTLKQLIARPRPFLTLMDVHMPDGIGRTDSGSMPSSHAANWFATTMILFIYYRRSLRYILPVALLVSFSRVYNGVHYPSDVLVGAILGAGYGAAAVWTCDALWRWAGQRWFPLWWQRLPSLMAPTLLPAAQHPANVTGSQANDRTRDQQWLRLGYVVILAHCAIKLLYIATAKIDLEQDEAYQWVWSKHLALSYYSKPPLIAYTQWLGTHLWGDTAFGVRFFSPVICAVVGIMMLRFLTRVVNARAAFWLSAALLAVPLLAIGSTLLTIDPLSVMFWLLAMVAGWRAVQPDSSTRDWLWVGCGLGLGFLSKYTGLFQLLSFAMVFALLPETRRQLRRPGPYLAVLVNLVCMVPVYIWNRQHGWITVHHVAEGGGFTKHWSFTVANLWAGFMRYTVDFIWQEALLLNPFFYAATLWACVGFWRLRKKNPLLLYCFSMGAPIVFCYFLLTFRSRVLPNWIAPAIVPFLCVATIYWDYVWNEGRRRLIKFWLGGGLALGFVAVLLCLAPNLVSKVTGRPLPARVNPLRRLEAWRETAQVVESARQKLLSEGRPAFIIGGHYGITSEVTFYLPEAKAGVPDHPLVYYQRATTPDNQYYFWPGYQERHGQNAIFVQELDFDIDEVPAIPPEIIEDFASVKDLGAVMVMFRGRPIRRIQLVECRGLR